MKALRGIDISHHQGSPDFKRIRAAGIKFVILKATEGVNYTDPCFHTNIKAALAAGLPAGAYHFLRATPLDRQISDFLAAIQPYRLTWPAALDVEHAELSGMGHDRLTDNVLTFCARIRAAGCKPLVYSNYNWLYAAKYLDAGRVRAAGVPVWMAWYSGATPANTDRSSLCDIWQYCSDGHVDGINCNVDCNVAYRDFGAAEKPAAEAQQTAVRVDTTGTVKLPHGGVYQLKTTCPQQPGVTSARPDIVKVLHRARLGEDDFWYLVAVGGRPGDGVGIYTAAPGEQGLRRMIVEIG
jgi:lysozyme